jgi:hypothetical protein
MTNTKPAFHRMPLQELAAWVRANDTLGFDSFPATDELDSDEETEVREEYEAMAEEIWSANAAK